MCQQHKTYLGRDNRSRGAYLALQCANLEPLESLASLVTMADILKRLRSVLTCNVKKDLLTAADKTCGSARAQCPKGEADVGNPQCKVGERIAREHARKSEPVTYGCSSTNLEVS